MDLVSGATGLFRNARNSGHSCHSRHLRHFVFVLVVGTVAIVVGWPCCVSLLGQAMPKLLNLNVSQPATQEFEAASCLQLHMPG